MSLSLALLALSTGVFAGLSLGMLGVGGSILVVPLLVYVMHVPPHLAIGTSTVAATASGAWSLLAHARGGTVRWRHGGTYALASVLGAMIGARLGQATDSQLLLALLGGLMIVVAGLMLRGSRRAPGASHGLKSRAQSWVLLQLGAMGLGIGALASLVGVGGGFLTVPALMFVTGMPLLNAVGSSLMAVTVVAGTTAVIYASSHLVAWRIAALLVAGGLLGGYVGVKLAVILAARRRALTVLFSVVVALVGLYMVIRGMAQLI
ncbi:MAG: sulfite exporter TauE/SafE family protein [Steroidobacteraceae bacterium]